MKHIEPSAVERSLAIYRRLLRAYPPAFRERYGDEMARVFRDAARAACRQTGFAGLIALWARTLTDTLVNAACEHVRGSEGSTAASRWKALESKMPPSVLAWAGVFAYLAAINVIRTLTNWVLLSVALPNRGWAVLLAAIVLGLLLPGVIGERRFVVRWRQSITWIGLMGWLLWFFTPISLGLNLVGRILPVVFILAIGRIVSRQRSPEEQLIPVRGSDHLFIAGPALLLLLLPGSGTPMATNVFLVFVVIINGVAAMLPPMVMKVRKSDADEE